MTDADDPLALRAGDHLADRYVLQALIATGGMARVWRANDTVLGRDVAVKILHPHLATDRGFLLRFRREAVAAARLSHRSIVGIYDTVSEGGNEAIVMELIDGRTLREILDERGVLSPADAIEIGSQITEALAAAHAGGVVHRDIKPSNILVCADRRVMVTDFGIAKAGEETDLTVTGTLLGTAKYLSPEQVAGDPIDPRADLYSLGVVLFEALSGQPPFQADTDAATALARLHQDPPHVRSIRPEIPDVLNAIVDRLLARAPNDRFQRARDVRTALSAVVLRSPSSDPTLIVTPEDGWAGTDHRDHDDMAFEEAIPGLELDDFAEGELDDDPGGFLRSERSWLLPALALGLVATGLIVAGALLARPLGDDSESSSDAPSQPSTEATGTTLLTNVETFGPPVIIGALDVDPDGDGTEHRSHLASALDGDDDTFWRTETYKDPAFGTKRGVGYLIELEGPSVVRSIEVDTNSDDWWIEVYVGDDFTTDIANWGEPDAILEGSGREQVDLDGRGRQVMLWITDPGLSEDDEDNPIRRFELVDVLIE